MLWTTLPWALVSLVADRVYAISLDANNAGSISSAAETVAAEMMRYYTGYKPGDNPGNLPEPYYWWEAGSMFGHMVDYWYYTGDTQYNDKIIQAITWQAGTSGSFMPQNQTKDEGNDDQVFWAFAAMDAAELGFPPPTEGYPSWAAMAQATFNTQAPRWDMTSCGGGLKWQIISFNSGYDYKNIASNGGFLKIAGQLARYTGNQTFVDWFQKEWDWLSSSVLYDDSNPDSIRIYDGTDDTQGCTIPNREQYSYNYGIVLAGLAYMYNHTSDQQWMPPLRGILQGIEDVFHRDGVMIEAICEPSNGCSTDALTFKGFTIRWMVVTAQLVPELADTIWPLIQSSAQGAAGQCDGGSTGNTCGYHWNETTWDGSQGVGQQMSALAPIQAMMIPAKDLKAPLTLNTGGTSKADPNAGTDPEDSDDSHGNKEATRVITGADRGGAGFVTALLLVGTLAGAFFMIFEGDLRKPLAGLRKQ